MTRLAQWVTEEILLARRARRKSQIFPCALRSLRAEIGCALARLDFTPGSRESWSEKLEDMRHTSSLSDSIRRPLKCLSDRDRCLDGLSLFTRRIWRRSAATSSARSHQFLTRETLGFCIMGLHGRYRSGLVWLKSI